MVGPQVGPTGCPAWSPVQDIHIGALPSAHPHTNDPTRTQKPKRNEQIQK